MKTVEPSSNPPQTALKYQGGHETTMIEITSKVVVEKLWGG